MSNLNNNTIQLESLLAKVNALPEAGIELPELTNEGSSADVLFGKQLIDKEGSVVTGSMPNNGIISKTFNGIYIKSVTIPSGYTTGGTVSLDNTIDNEVSEQSDLIAQIKNAVNSLPEVEDGEINLQDKTVTPTTTSQTVSADSGYDGLNKVTVDAIPSTYIKPLSIKSATTYTPTTSNQTIAAGTYCSGAQTIRGDVNLIPDNIVSGKTIFGVTGTAETGSGSGGSTTGITLSVKNSLECSIIVNGRYCEAGQTIDNVPYDDGFVNFTIMIMDMDGSIIENYI